MTSDWKAKALTLFLTLNKQAMLYTPNSRKGKRARRISQRLAVRLATA